ncbi:hypothetical protein [Streptomyces endophytica]|uniref:Transmembrane protein n=1 Tax=Streptomyces endophytica TaxID=2991496 RepID=A0ABY6P634_9ACTN|nr:hypothetical protein [Streptomyces endophytica]UZJ29250.1 hypothetical protein OJ254_00460 [Streptomyces endophytica]
MEAGPRNRAQQPDNGADTDTDTNTDTAPLTVDGPHGDLSHDGFAEDGPSDGDALGSDPLTPSDPLGTSVPLGHPDALDATGALDDADGPDAADGSGEGGESFRELRPPRRLRLWQLAPIVGLAALGSLMFAFPLAFEFGGDGGAVIAMLGLLLCCCAAGWGMMAARRVGHTWPGLPARGSGRRASWRVVLLYALVVAVPAALAIWRVARLR